MPFPRTVLVAVVVASAPVVAQEDDASLPPPFPFPDFEGHAEVWHGATTGIDEQRFAVIGSRTEWAALWREHDANAKPPAVDFRNNLVLCVCNPAGFPNGFRVDKIARGALASDQFSYNVVLAAQPKHPTEPGNVFEFVRVPRTRFDFRIFATNGEKPQRIARVESVPASSRAVAIEKRAHELLDVQVREPARKEATIAALVALGEPARPVLNAVCAKDRKGDVFLAIEVLQRRLAESVAGHEVRTAEVAIERALAAVKARAKFHGEPWWIGTVVRCEKGVWCVKSQGTWMVSSGMKEASQEDLDVRVALRAEDGKVLACDIERGPLFRGNGK